IFRRKRPGTSEHASSQRPCDIAQTVAGTDLTVKYSVSRHPSNEMSTWARYGIRACVNMYIGVSPCQNGMPAPPSYYETRYIGSDRREQSLVLDICPTC